MAHNKKFGEFMVAVSAVPAQLVTSTKLEASSVDATGFDRATFIFEVGNHSSTTAALAAGSIVWKAASSGDTYYAITGASFGRISGITGSSMANYIIDMDVDQSYPWLLVSAQNSNTTAYYSVTCILRTPEAMPPDSLSGQIVYV
jgi:hypothetical protein